MSEYTRTSDLSDGEERTQIVIEDAVLRGGFTQIPNVVLQRSDIGPGAKLTYVALLFFAWQGDRCFPGQDSLALVAGVSVRSIKIHLQQLDECGLIAVRRRGHTKTNVYTLRSLV
jgi:hypothetical protein